MTFPKGNIGIKKERKIRKDCTNCYHYLESDSDVDCDNCIDLSLYKPCKMIQNRVMLQRAIAWLESCSEIIHTENRNVIASYMAAFAQEQIKSFQSKEDNQ